jgi:ureidoglycolate hydrolase
MTTAGDMLAVLPLRLTEEAWSPFGWLPVPDTDPRDGEHRLEYQWGDAHVNLIGHLRSEVPETPRGLRCEMLYRHDTHTQALIVLDVPAVIAVAPAGVAFNDVADVAAIRVFQLQPLEPLVLHRGTWHWGPFPTSAPEVRLFNVQGLRYAEDNRRIDLDTVRTAVEVVLK